MKPNLFTTAICAAATLLACMYGIKEAQGRSLMIDKNQQQSGIYSEMWNNNDETDNFKRNSWFIDLNDNKKEEANDDTECVNGGTCNDQQQHVLRTPIKKEAPSPSGWGAGGMPFNILYMKNPKPAKSMRSQFLSPAQSTTYGIVSEPLRTQAIKEPVPQAQRQYQNPDGHEDATIVRYTETPQRNSALQNSPPPVRNSRPKGRSSNGIFTPSRRYYSILPQLFVSYGWGPITK